MKRSVKNYRASTSGICRGIFLLLSLLLQILTDKSRTASPVLTTTGLVTGRGQLSTTHTEFTPLNRSQKFGTGDYVSGPYGCAKFGANMPTGALGKWVKYITIFIYWFILFYLRTNLQVRPVDGFSRLVAHKMIVLWLKRWYYSASRWHSGDVMVGNVTFLMIFAVDDPSPLTLWINCSF